ncbi:MAG: hypothetical protein E7076_07170 [Bacteroidales bacterium]|nr:hypothetical protein [Bacteroidales bacterium]
MEEVIPQGYIDLSWLPSEFLTLQGLDIKTVLAKKTYISSLINGAIGNELVRMGYERNWIEMELFESIVENPRQIRDGGANALLLIRRGGGYWVSADTYFDVRYYAMRIVPFVDKDGNKFWEFIDFDFDYNINRQDTVLWKSEEP